MNNQFVDLSKYNQIGYSKGRPNWQIFLWDITWLLLVRPCPQAFYSWKRFIWRLFGAKIGKGVLLRSTARCNYPWKVTIGDHSWIGEEVWLYSLDTIKIGSNVVISQRAYLCTGSHSPTSSIFSLETAPIIINDCAWIALSSIVLQGVNVGKGAVLAANSMARTNLTDWSIYAGSPAKLIGTRNIVH